MEKDLPVVYVTKKCFIVLFLTKINNVIYCYLYETTQNPKNSYAIN